ASAAGCSNDPRNFQRVVWATCWRAGSSQFRVPVLLHEGGAGPGNREHGEDRAVRVHPSARARTRGKSLVFASAERGAGRSFECRTLAGCFGRLAETEQGAASGGQSIL